MAPSHRGKPRGTATFWLSSTLVIASLVGCAPAAPPASVEEPDEQVVYAIPEGCPTAEEFSQARFGENDRLDPIDFALLNAEVNPPMPEGGCAYTRRQVGTADNSASTYRQVIVHYFNIEEPGRRTSAEMRDWGISGGGTPTAIVDFETGEATGEFSETALTLPIEFSGWTDSTVFWREGEDLGFWLDQDVIPAFIQGAFAQLSFSMDEERVNALVEASQSGAVVADPVTALSQGLAAAFSSTFSIADDEGYTADIAISGRLQPWTSDVVDAPPGEFNAVASADVAGTQTNTTPARNVAFNGVAVVVLYPRGPEGCVDSVGVSAGNGSGSTYCFVELGRLPTAALGPDEVQTTPSSTVQLKVGPFPESGSSLSALNSPSAIYASFGGRVLGGLGLELTGDRGCRVQTDQGARWVVPMNGWPDSLCG